jgi:hypothetical protein
MYVERIPNRNSPPAILLCESYREGNKIKKRTLANLSAWPAAEIEALPRVLREDAVVPTSRDGLTLVRSLPHGHVAAVVGTLRKLGLRRAVAGRPATGARRSAVRCPDGGARHRSGIEAGDGARARR